MSDSIKAADRRLKLLMLLQSSRHLTVNKIADYFGISRRTVFRDLRALQDLNVPLIHDQTEGYSLIKGYKIPPLMFNEKELATIILSLSSLSSNIDQSMSEDADTVLHKIKSVLSTDLLEFANSIEEHVIANPYSNLKSELQSSDWFTICLAISELSHLQFQYQTESKTSIRTVEPHLIVHYFDHWNLLAYDIDKKEFRNFKLMNISKSELLPVRYKKIKKEFYQSLIYNFDSDQTKKYTILIKLRSINKFLFQFPGRIVSRETVEDLVRLEFEFDSLDWIAEYLIAFIDDIKIESKDLKSTIREKLEQKLKSL